MPAFPSDLRTARLVGRPPEPGDLDALVALYTDPAVAAAMDPPGRPRAEADVAAALDADIAHWGAHGFGRLLWTEPGDRAVVVRCGAKHAIVGDRPEIDIHWTVRPDRWRRGLAAEAASAVVEACFAALGVASVTACARFDNAPSQALALSVGFAYERDVRLHGQRHRAYRRTRGG